MSTLLVEPLYNKLEQEIEYNGNNRVLMGAFAPYLYIHNVVSSSVFRFEIEKNSNIVFSQVFTAEDIFDETNANYAHIFHPIVPPDPVQLENGIYKFRIVSVSGYLDSLGNIDENSFIGWIRQYENIQNEMSYQNAIGSKISYAIRFKEYKEGIRI